MFGFYNGKTVFRVFLHTDWLDVHQHYIQWHGRLSGLFLCASKCIPCALVNGHKFRFCTFSSISWMFLETDRQTENCVCVCLSVCLCVCTPSADLDLECLEALQNQYVPSALHFWFIIVYPSVRCLEKVGCGNLSHVFCVVPWKWTFFLTLCVFGSGFRTLAVNNLQKTHFKKDIVTWITMIV